MNKLLASNGQSPMLQNEYLREYLYIFGSAMPELLKKRSRGVKETDTANENSSTDTEGEPIFEVPLLILDTKKVKLHLRDANPESGGSGLTGSGLLDSKEGYDLFQ